MKWSVKTRNILIFLVLVLAASSFFVLRGTMYVSAKSDKDKTPPVISDLHVDPIADTSATIVWTTDEPADSAVRYGIDPKTNIKGPEDSALVLSHAAALSGLTPATTYAYCAESADASNNKAEACDTFTTLAEPPPSPVASSGGSALEQRIHISGYAYPDAVVTASLSQIPFHLGAITSTTTASSNGSFSFLFDRFGPGLYRFTISATDRNGVVSTRKGLTQFSYTGGALTISNQKIILPPTITVTPEAAGLDSTIEVSGSTLPNTGVLIQAGGISHETESDSLGTYTLLLDAASFGSGQVAVRARSTAISTLGYDYSHTKTITILASSAPEADINNDGVVNLQDVSSYMARPIDMNGDGKVDAADISIFLRAFVQE